MPVDEVAEDSTPAVPDVSAFEAKIAELNAAAAERDIAFAALTNDLAKAKAQNYDLIMAAPADKVESEPAVQQSAPVAGSFDHLFK